MLGDIFQFLLNILFTLFGAAILVRAWMHAVRLHPFNPVARTLMQATDWLVLPLRRITPAGRSIDWACVVAVWLTALVYIYLQWLATYGMVLPLAYLPLALLGALITAVKWFFNLLVWATLLQAVLSWINPMAPVMPVLQTLTDPLLDPIRRILPRTGIDFSPLVLLVLAQVVLMVISHLSFMIVRI
jgi:YggT family protein